MGFGRSVMAVTIETVHMIGEKHTIAANDQQLFREFNVLLNVVHAIGFIYARGALAC
jgi:hypothetical protein